MTIRTHLFATPDVRVTFVEPPDASRDLCFVTFDSFSNNETLDRPGFGEAFFESRRIPAIHVVSRRNWWYQEPEIPLALEAARHVASRFAHVLSYGSSMGGYGAIRFGAAAGATTAIAISPQYSLDRRKVPFENRWATQSDTIAFINEETALPAALRAFVFYDPRDLDRLHVDLIARDVPVERLRLPYAGHPAGAYLAETGLLQTAITAIGGGHFDPGIFEAEARTARRRSGQYLFTLARLQPLRRLKLKLDLARMAVAVAPSDPEYLGYLGFILDHVGLTSEAGDAYRTGLVHGPGQPLALERYGRHLLRLGSADDARRLLEDAALAGRGLPRVHRSYGLALIATGAPRNGLRVLWRLAVTHPKTRRVIAREVILILWWLSRGKPRSPERTNPVASIRLDTSRDLIFTKQTERRYFAGLFRPLRSPVRKLVTRWGLSRA